MTKATNFAAVALAMAAFIAPVVTAHGTQIGRAADESAAEPSTITGAYTGSPYLPAMGGGDDTFYNTWADNDKLFITNDDSRGFTNDKCHSDGFGGAYNFTVNEVTGDDPSQLALSYVNCMASYGSAGSHQNYNDGRTWKTDGVISVDGTLYVVVVRQEDAGGGYPVGFQPSSDASIVKSTDHGRTWTNSFGTRNDPDGAAPPVSPSGHGAMAMFPGDSFPTPVFINYGQDDAPLSTADGGDKYVYAMSNDGFAYNGNYIFLGRVLRSKIGDLNASDWQFYTGPAGGDGADPGNWSSNSRDATHLISATHQLGQSGVQYIPALHTYVLTSFYYPHIANWPNDGGSAHSTWDFYEAPTPWGPWTRFFDKRTVRCYLACDPRAASPMGLYDPALVSKFIRMDGLSNTIFTSGDFIGGQRADGNVHDLAAMPFTLVTRNRKVVDDATAFPVGVGAWHASYGASFFSPFSPVGYYNYSAHYSNEPGTTISHTFYGNSIAWVGARNSNNGYAEVSIDGGPSQSVDTYAAQTEKQSILFRKTGLPNGKHTISITVTSRKDPASTGVYQNLDAFVVGHSG